MKVLILGAGVIGITTAYYLARDGVEVHVVDRQAEPAAETSHANGGVLHTSEAEPWSRPGAPWQMLRWIGRTDAPMLLRLSALPFMWRWGLAFAARSNTRDYRTATRANLRLSVYTLGLIKQLREDLGLDYDQSSLGSMKIYSDRRAFDLMSAEAEAMREFGMDFEAIDPDRAVAIEPALASARDTMVGALHYPPDEAGDCAKFTQALAAICEGLGVTFHYGRAVRRLQREGSRITAVETDRGQLAGDAVVVAMGSYSPMIARPLGIRLPIYPVKGVTVTVPAAPWPDGPRMPIIDDRRLFGINRLGDRYRCPGTVEIARYDARPDPRRCEALVRNVIDVFPGFADCYDRDTARFWAGLRPMTPSGNPYLGRTGYDNLYLNTGHGHLGWTMSCGSAKVVADCVLGRRPEIDLGGLTLVDHT